jgi:hypothetical protein
MKLLRLVVSWEGPKAKDHEDQATPRLLQVLLILLLEDTLDVASIPKE